jgi:hypothetical protein
VFCDYLKAASNTSILKRRILKLFGIIDDDNDESKSGHTAATTIETSSHQEKRGTQGTAAASYLTTTEMMKMSGVSPPPELAPPVALSAFLTGTKAPALERRSQLQSSSLSKGATTLSSQTSSLHSVRTESWRGSMEALEEEKERGATTTERQLLSHAHPSSSYSSSTARPPKLCDLFYAFHGSSTPQAVALAKSAGSLPFWAFCRSRDIPRHSTNAEPALLRPSWYNDLISSSDANNRQANEKSSLLPQKHVQQSSQQQQQQQQQQHMGTTPPTRSTARTIASIVELTERPSTASVARSSTSSLSSAQHSARTIVPNNNQAHASSPTPSTESLRTLHHLESEVEVGRGDVSCFSTASPPSSSSSSSSQPVCNTKPSPPSVKERQSRRKKKPKQHPTSWVELDISLMEMVLFHRR